MLSGYRLMWMMVLFDLPTVTEKERRAANRFRNFLLDQGFERCQLSVYLRFCAGKEQTQVYSKRIQKALPEAGNVQIICFTDKQYENIVSFQGPIRQPAIRIRCNTLYSDIAAVIFSSVAISRSEPVSKLDRRGSIVADGRSGSNRNAPTRGW